jgi:hypothetical protein
MQSVYLCLGGGTAEKGRRRVWNIVVLWREREVVERERERERGRLVVAKRYQRAPVSEEKAVCARALTGRGELHVQDCAFCGTGM